MQKKSLFLLFLFVLFSGAAYAFSFSMERVYDYPQIVQKIKFNSDDITALTLDRPMNSWVISVPQSKSSDKISVIWEVDGKRYMRALDTEEPDTTGRYYTFPLVTPLQNSISLRILGGVDLSDVTLIATDTESYRVKMVFDSSIAMAQDPVNIISRQDWGVDESLRFVPQSIQKQRQLDWESRGKKPIQIELTQSGYLSQLRMESIEMVLKQYHPESFSIVKKIRYDQDMRMIWPQNYAKRVDRVVLHHTAETPLQAQSDDRVVLRSIYTYHARTRGWGDIGYNYIIGKDGAIYEGRKGGDFIEGAHAYANNLGTVGISLLGNYDIQLVPDAQIDSLFELLVWVSRKYGINVEEYTTGFRPCGKNSAPDCIIEPVRVQRLYGHRDVGYTSCPGKNLYDILPTIRSRVASRVGKVIPVDNMDIGPIEEPRGYDHIIYRMPEKKPETNSLLLRPSSSLGGKKIKILLSYPDKEKIDLSIVSIGIPRLSIDNKKIPQSSSKKIEVGIVGNDRIYVKSGERVFTGTSISYAAPVVRIDSWTRIPAWDTTKRHNDNLFRAKIILINQGGKLSVINELPIEDYLRGLGEVSNSDNAEKIKTITVAARSYARYYMLPKNRKYGTLLYDGSDDPDSFQRYLGYGYELRSPNVSREVRNTLGEVITYQNSIIKAWYFSVSSGHTLSFLEYCQSRSVANCQDIPYLQSVSDPAGNGKTQLGHGVGISGIGATAMAEAGKTYKDIIQYYLKGVAIEKK